MTRETTIYWPVNILGCPLRATYARDQVLRYNKIEVDDGPPRFRLQADEELQNVDMSFLFDEDQLYEFEKFHDEDLRGGSNWFHLPMLTGDGMVDCYAHFQGGWTMTPHQELLTHYEVTFTALMFRTAETQPPVLVLSDPIDGLSITAARPVDIVDAGSITANPLPPDVIDGMAPEVWP